MLPDSFNHDNKLHMNDDVESICLIDNRSSETPFFTIIIPTHNRAKYLTYALESALKQTFDNYNILINEDGPGKNGESPEDIIRGFNSGKISYFRNARNIGLYWNFNRASLLANGKYIVMLHDDDMLDENYLHMAYMFIRKHHDTEMLGTALNFFESDGRYDFDGENKGLDRHHILYKHLRLEDIYYGHDIGIVGMTYLKKAFIDYGGFKWDLYGMDSDSTFTMNIAAKNTCYIIKSAYRFNAYRKFINCSLNEDVMVENLIRMHTRRVNSSKGSVCTRLSERGAKYSDNHMIRAAENDWNMRLDMDSIMQKCGHFDSSAGMLNRLLYQTGKGLYYISRERWKREEV